MISQVVYNYSIDERVGDMVVSGGKCDGLIGWSKNMKNTHRTLTSYLTVIHCCELFVLLAVFRGTIPNITNKSKFMMYLVRNYNN